MTIPTIHKEGRKNMSVLTVEQKENLNKYGFCIIVGKINEGMSYKAIQLTDEETS
ncbi:hypothetical protein V7O67_05280 [Methanolobus sp. ZRKC4]|uniref:hypothetical protein n=1 Tax=Methanolobus sp. ZRKC4 TaxID=3125787 RepID=UPI0032557691